MSTWEGTTYYYSGQGNVLIGPRDINGKPAGLIPVGNVSDLKITITPTVVEHKESQTGQRAIDLRLTTEMKSGISMTMESFNKDNLAIALRGTKTLFKVGGTVSAESPKPLNYWGKVVPLQHAKVSSVTVARPGPESLTAFVTAGTAFDYYENDDAGSIKMNDGQSLDGLLTANATAGGVSPSAITVGNPTKITVANSAKADDMVAVSGFSGADAAILNSKAFRIVDATSTYVDIDVDTTGKTITLGTPLAVFDGEQLSIGYTYDAQNRVDSLMLAPQEMYLRFEGLNTADGNKPVVVEVFRFLVDPLKELAMISDTIQQFVLEGDALLDPLQSTGSQYFKVTLLR